MTSPDPLADMVVARDGAIELLRAQAKEMAAEIERLRARDLAAFDEIRHLRARIADLESSLHVWRKAFSDVVQIAQTGTLEKPTPDEPARYTHDIPPSAPPHDE